MESINRTRVIAAYENMISDELRALLNSRPPKDVCCRARARRVAILKSRRIKARTRPPETGLVLPIYEDDYVHFLATDSDSDHGDREDQTDDDNAMDYDFVEHLDNADECIMEQEGFGSIPIINVKPGLTENGYFDDGDPFYTCQNCGAYMWFGEHINKRGAKNRPIFSTCCMKGKVELPKLKNPPPVLMSMLYGKDERSKNFRALIRAYNMMFSFTSLGGQIDNSVNHGNAPYVFRMQGQNYHRIGELLPGPSKSPAFSQLYIHDTVNEVSNRMGVMGEKGPGKQIKKSIVKTLKDMLDANNPHVIAFRSARDRLAQCEDTSGFKLILKNHRDSDGRVQNIPTTDEVAGLIVGDINPKPRDVVLQANSGGFQRISELHPSYLPLQYPLLFPYGEDGFRLGIDIGFIDKGGLKRTKVTSIWSISINFDFDFILRENKDKIVQI
ncbi:uncharacterized protein LOC110228539 [Arabidopsis lyrata subsp. lyrata]|uniref:uncharacterized protein LOC110228539 n=1 Tax=Arabidopsis lyrata subsp. lyrata TaxID=81972 RepID=UPI000A29DC34|nr:uncharacterized protein LOC110228539 [Arabidopsis lyrata subsp. lyrata]|eukprot:XP_020881868.1 uncharacterized protein LOC110228539 [Arabidopsis lyrata subsp. lyrata]